MKWAVRNGYGERVSEKMVENVGVEDKMGGYEYDGSLFLQCLCYSLHHIRSIKTHPVNDMKS